MKTQLNTYSGCILKSLFSDGVHNLKCLKIIGVLTFIAASYKISNSDTR